MHVGHLEVEISLSGRPLVEFGQECFDPNVHSCSVLAPETGGRRYTIRLRDDTTNITDTHGLRAEAVISIDGEIRTRTRNCILLRGISEFSFSIVELPFSVRPPIFSLAGMGDDADKDPQIQFNLIEVAYRRFHKSFSALPVQGSDSGSPENTNTLVGHGNGFRTSNAPDVEVYDPLHLSFRCMSISRVIGSQPATKLNDVNMRMHHTPPSSRPSRGDFYEMSTQESFQQTKFSKL